MRAFLLVFAALLGALAVVSRNDEPGPRQFKFEWLTVVGAPICLALFVLGFVIVNRTRISLHPEGIAQEVFRRRGRKVTSDITLVRWDDVADLRLEAHPNPAVPNRHAMPVIRVVRRSVEPAMFIMACEKKVEPNALLALMQWCRGHQWARAQLGADNARELLRPPSLRDRIRADRAAS